MTTADKQDVVHDFEAALKLRDAGSYREGIALLEKVVVRLTLTDQRLMAMSHMQIAFMYGQMGNQLAAEHHFRVATCINPQSELASLGLFHALIGLLRIRDAMSEMLRFLQLRDSSQYRDLMFGEFAGTLQPDLASLRDEVLILLRRHAQRN